MAFIIVIITTLFICIAFVTNQQLFANTFLSYFSSELEFVLANITVFIFGIVLLTLYFARSTYVHHKHKLHIKLSTAFSHAVKLLLLSFLLAYVFLFIIAFIQLNMFALLLNTHPQALGVTQDANAIVTFLQSDTNVPEILASDADPKQALVSVAFATTGKDNFYSKYVLPAIPQFLIFPITTMHAHILLVNNTLVFTQMDAHDFKKIGPVAVNLFVKAYFYNKRIKNIPQMSVMDKAHYVAYKKAVNAKTLAKINTDLQTIQQNIASFSAAVVTDKQQITSNQTAIATATVQQATDYKNCLAADKPLADCKSLRAHWDTLITNTTNAGTKLQNKLQSDQNTLANFQYYYNFYTLERKVMINKTGTVSNELGEFVPPNMLQIVMYTDNSHATADYLETLTHEYLHYTSYISENKKFTDSFFEEALTEYFARNITKAYLHTDTNLGYPLQVKIMDQLATAIPETELEDIYMSKDEQGLETTLDRVYGDGFYEKNHLLLQLLQYTQDPKQALDIANKIMQIIGGPKVTEKDLMSNYSHL